MRPLGSQSLLQVIAPLVRLLAHPNLTWAEREELSAAIAETERHDRALRDEKCANPVQNTAQFLQSESEVQARQREVAEKFHAAAQQPAALRPGEIWWPR